MEAGLLSALGSILTGGQNAISGASAVLLDNGAKPSGTTYTSPAWLANAYDIVEFVGRIAAVNAGASWQSFWAFQGPAGNTFCSTQMWGAGATGIVNTVSGTPGGLGASLGVNQTNLADEKIVHGIWFPKMRFGRTAHYDLIASGPNQGNLQYSFGAAASTDMVTPVTGLILSWNSVNVVLEDMLLVGASFKKIT